MSVAGWIRRGAAQPCGRSLLLDPNGPPARPRMRRNHGCDQPALATSDRLRRWSGHSPAHVTTASPRRVQGHLTQCTMMALPKTIIWERLSLLVSRSARNKPHSKLHFREYFKDSKMGHLEHRGNFVPSLLVESDLPRDEMWVVISCHRLTD